MRSRAYSVLSRPAMRVSGSDGQYAIGEMYKGFYSLRWTTALPAARVFHEFSSHVDRTFKFEVRVDCRSDRLPFEHEPGRTDAEEVLVRARRAVQAPGVTHFVIDYSDGSLHWENVAGSAFHEIGIASPELGPDVFRALSEALGTPAIADNVEDLREQLAFVWE